MQIYKIFASTDMDALTVALVHLCTILHPLMWVFFLLSKCVKWLTFSILQDYAITDVVALKWKF